MSNNVGTNWPAVRLRNVTTKIGSGATPRGGKEAYKDNGITLIRSLNVYDFKFDYDGLAYIDDKQAKELSNVEVRPFDILLNITGASVARCCIVPQKLLPARVNQHVAIVRVYTTVANPLYVLYVINSPQYKHHLLTLAQGGATREALTKDTIGDFKIPLPPLPTQRKIAAILSAYDDLIENNTRRIAILEEMAQSLYREWFVHFRFPGHEKNTMVESPLGMVPEGWDIKAFGELLKYHIGGGWGKDSPDKEYTEPAYVIRGTDIPDARYISIIRCPLRFHTKSNVASRYIQPKDVIFEVSGGSKGQPVGRALQVSQQLIDAFDENVICASFCKVLRIDERIVAPEILFLHLQEIYGDGRIEKYQVQSTGIINFKFAFFLESEMVVVPPQKLQGIFTEIVAPMLEEVQVLGAKNATLRRTRNLLLPKLIAGELDVEALDIEVGGDAEHVSVQEEVEAVARQDEFAWG